MTLMVPSSWLARSQLDRRQRSPISPTRKEESYQSSAHELSKTRSIHRCRLTKCCISPIAPPLNTNTSQNGHPCAIPWHRRLNLPHPSNQTYPRCLKNNAEQNSNPYHPQTSCPDIAPSPPASFGRESFWGGGVRAGTGGFKAERAWNGTKSVQKMQFGRRTVGR